MKYPPANCVEVEESQGDSFKSNSFAEWDRNFDSKNNEIEKPIYMGLLKCYCDI